MDWIQFSIFVGGILGCFFWNRSESRTDIRFMETKLESTRELVRAIHDEMKDFHTRLERIDMEFRSRQEKQDIEFRSRMERQDAEFKSHIIYMHTEGKKT